MLHDTDDKLIPFRHGEDIFAAAASKNKKMVVLQQQGHHDIWGEEGATAIFAFLDKR